MAPGQFVKECEVIGHGRPRQGATVLTPTSAGTDILLVEQDSSELAALLREWLSPLGVNFQRVTARETWPTNTPGFVIAVVDPARTSLAVVQQRIASVWPQQPPSAFVVGPDLSIGGILDLLAAGAGDVVVANPPLFPGLPAGERDRLMRTVMLALSGAEPPYASGGVNPGSVASILALHDPPESQIRHVLEALRGVLRTLVPKNVPHRIQTDIVLRAVSAMPWMEDAARVVLARASVASNPPALVTELAGEDCVTILIESVATVPPHPGTVVLFHLPEVSTPRVQTQEYLQMTAQLGQLQSPEFTVVSVVPHSNAKSASIPSGAHTLPYGEIAELIVRLFYLFGG
jgi:hypothetical protein